MMAESPTPPQPCTATHSPGEQRPLSMTALKEVTKRQPKPAAVSNAIVSGRRTRLRSAYSNATNSAKEPQQVKPGCTWLSQMW
jgi:hypothetical protein